MAAEELRANVCLEMLVMKPVQACMHAGTPTRKRPVGLKGAIYVCVLAHKYTIIKSRSVAH